MVIIHKCKYEFTTLSEDQGQTSNNKYLKFIFTKSTRTIITIAIEMILNIIIIICN